jgi:Ca-activated chloride channel family protein
MKTFLKQLISISLLSLPTPVMAWHMQDLWQTPDQQGSTLLQAGKPQAAASVFKNKDWQAVAHYKSGDYKQALQQFSGKKTSDDQYNAGNAAANLGQYKAALNYYDKAIALNSNNTDAITNRDIVKKLMEKKQQQQQQSQINSSSEQDEKAKQDQNNTQANKDNKQEQKNSAPNKSGEPQTAQNNQNKNQANGSHQQSKPNNPTSEQVKNGNQPSDQTVNAAQQNAAANADDKGKEEDNNQLLRRLADDPGGLLRQKFLRDYIREHGTGDGSDQGEPQ